VTFNPLDHPVIGSYPKWNPQSTWTEYIPIAMLLIDLLRPSKFVQLGAHDGVLYCAFCQAVKELAIDCRCTVVDNWHGDKHTEAGEHNAVREFAAHHDEFYSAFSQLTQGTFDDACARFADGGVDILCMDGDEFDDAAYHNFELWLPKMTDCGVVVLYNIADTRENTGVGKLWNELEKRFSRHLVLHHGNGLGVVAVGDAIPERARGLFELRGPARSGLGALMYSLGSRIEERQYATRLRAENRELDAQLARAAEQATVEGWQLQFLEAQEQIEIEQEEELRRSELTIADARRQIRALTSRLSEVQWQLKWLESSRGVRAVKLIRAARNMLQQNGPAAFVKHIRQWTLGRRGYNLSEIPFASSDQAPGRPFATMRLHGGVLFISGVPNNAMRYRCDHKAESLGFAGYTCDVAVHGQIDLTDAVSRYACFVLHRVPNGEDVQAFIAEVRRRNKLVFFDTDDWVFDPEAARYVAAIAELAPHSQRAHIESFKSYQRTMIACHGVIVSTETLRQLVLPFHNNVVVVPNVVSQSMQQGADIALAGSKAVSQTGQCKSIAIGYFSGTPTHNTDFLQAADSILWALEHHPNLVFKVIGSLRLDKRFDKFRSRVMQFPVQPWQDLPRLFCTVDINIAPLELDNPYADAKSCIKFLEAALCRVPTIASPTTDFVRLIHNGENGFLADTQAEWSDALAQLIASHELRTEIGSRASGLVRAQETTLARSTSLQRAMRSLAEKAGSPSRGRMLTINWILDIPRAEFDNANRTTFYFASFLGGRGHKVTVYVKPRARLSTMAADQIKGDLEKCYGVFNGDLVIGQGQITPADISIATSWTTAITVDRHADSKRKFYFIQQFEPELYDLADSRYSMAEDAFRLPLKHICAGADLGQRIDTVSGRDSEVIDLSVNQSIFHVTCPPDEREGPPKVLFFACPGFDRRGFELGVQALDLVIRMRPDVEILLYGSEDDEIGALPFTATNLGILSDDELAGVLNGVHVQLSLSLSRRSWAPFRGMACGAAVIEADVPATREAITGDGVCLFAAPDADSVFAALMRLFEDEVLRDRIASMGAVSLAKKNVERSLAWKIGAEQFEENLVSDSWL
jgi:glycosyltransferase involved in cell wall biosynthesis